MDLAHKIADRLLEIKAVKLNPKNPFTWASGLRSPIYCDNRKALSFPAIRKEIIDGFVQKSGNFQAFDAIAGVATAGIPWGAYLADRLDKPFVYVRSKPKEHGLQNRLEGSLNPTASVLVIEDLVSTGGSSLEVVGVLESLGHPVKGLISIFQYGFSTATAKFYEKNVDFESLTDFSMLLEQALLQNYIDKTEF
ncbi:MAG: orotate phosphoribosyltransferase, partial [Saprospiraceae bacterium]